MHEFGWCCASQATVVPSDSFPSSRDPQILNMSHISRAPFHGLIAFGSELGNSEEIAKMLYCELKALFDGDPNASFQLHEMNNVADVLLINMKKIFLLYS